MLQVAGPHAVRDSTPHKVPVRSAAEVTGFHDDAAVVLTRVDVFPRRPATFQVLTELVQDPLELALPVKDRYDAVAAFTTIGIVGVVPHHEPSDRVVFEVNRAHVGSLPPRTRCAGSG